MSPPPCSVAAGIDTWYLNRLDPAGLTPELRMQLEDLQELARHNGEEVETPWRYDGAPLLMYRAGVNTNQGGGVSWSYILRNASLTLLIRKTPLGSIIVQARLGSECLWRLTPRRTLDELDALVRRMRHGACAIRASSRAHGRSARSAWRTTSLTPLLRLSSWIAMSRARVARACSRRRTQICRACTPSSMH